MSFDWSKERAAMAQQALDLIAPGAKEGSAAKTNLLAMFYAGARSERDRFLEPEIKSQVAFRLAQLATAKKENA